MGPKELIMLRVKILNFNPTNQAASVNGTGGARGAIVPPKFNDDS